MAEQPALALGVYDCSGLTSGTYSVTFTATPGAIIRTDKGSVNGSEVENIPAGQTAIITATLAGCSDSRSAFSDCGLPVTLIRFNAEQVEQQVKLTWQTSEEINSAFFEIQRSANGTHWETLGVTPAQGMSNENRAYTFHDQAPLPVQNLCRLKWSILIRPSFLAAR